MDLSEIARYLNVGLAHSVTIDVREIEAAPGVLRVVTIRRGNSVTIEYEPALEYVTGDFEGGGLKYVASYDTLEDAVRDLEEYLGTPVEGWRNFTRNPYEPTIVEQPDALKNQQFFEAQVRARSIALPRRARYDIAGIHWRHIERYGEYRPDKLLEEAELALARRYGDDGDEVD